MEIVRDIKTMREKVAEMKRQVSQWACTDHGVLARGHLALIDTARKENDVVVVSDFVNPFSLAQRRLPSLPRDMDRTHSFVVNTEWISVCAHGGRDVSKKGNQVDVFVDVKHLDENLCGRFRPGHFRGVVTVVTKLFNIVSPNRA